MSEQDYETLIERKKFLEKELEGIDTRKMKEIYLSRNWTFGVVIVVYMIITAMIGMYIDKYTKDTVANLLIIPIYAILSPTIGLFICNFITEILVKFKFRVNKIAYADYFRISYELKQLKMQIEDT